MMEKQLKVTLLGATGFLGSALSDSLERKGIDWIGVTVEPTQHPKIVTISPNDTRRLIQTINDYPIVINATGALKPKDFERNTKESLEKFWKLVEHFSAIYASSKLEKLVHISSGGTVYGEGSFNHSHKEKDILSPISWYGRAKLFEELHYEKLANTISADYLCVRVSNPYGNPNKSNHGFIDVLINNILSGKDTVIYEDSDPIRDFVYASDMADTIVNNLIKNELGTFNIASGCSYSLMEIVGFAKQFSSKVNVIRSGKKPEYDVLNNMLDIRKTKNNNTYIRTTNVVNYIESKLNFVEKFENEAS